MRGWCWRFPVRGRATAVPARSTYCCGANAKQRARCALPAGASHRRLRDRSMSADSSSRRRWLRAVWRPLASYVLFLAGGVMLLRMDPFGFTRLTKYYSQDLLAVAMAGCYPAAAGGKCAKDGRAETAVVLLRDPDLRAFEEPWPPRYGFHARVLRAIRANKPKAVVMDIVFEDKRDDATIAALAAELDRYRAEGIPVYAATFGPDRPLRPEVGDRVTPVQVPKKIDPLDRVTRFYDLTTGPPDPQLTAVP